VSDNTAVDYIKANYRPDDRLAVVVIDKRSGEVKQRLATVERIAQSNYQAWLRYENAQRREIYISPNSIHPGALGREKADVQYVRHVYADFDHDAATRVAAMQDRKNMPTPNHIGGSSPGKSQVIWRAEGFTKDQAEELMRGLVREFGADPACTDVSRVLRLPGFVNHKYEKPHLVTVQNVTDKVYRPESFPEFAKEQPRAYAGDRNGTKRADGAPISQSEKDWSFAKRHLALGADPEKITAQIALYRSFDRKHADPRAYAERTVNRALQQLNQHERTR